MATERQPPDAIAVLENLSGPLADIDEDPDSPDGNFLTWGGSGAAGCLVNFPTPTGNPTVGAGLQEFRVQIRRDGAGSGGDNCGWSIELWDGGSNKGSIATGTLTDDTAVVVSGTWNASSLDTADGSGVQCKIRQTSGSGTRGIEPGAFEWNVDYSTGTTYNETGSGTATSGGTADPPELVQPETGSGTATASGAATHDQTHVEAGSGTATSSGAASDAQTHAASGSGAATAGGTGTPTGTISEAGSGTVVAGGSAAPGQAHAEAGSGTAVSGGTGAEWLSYDEVGSGAATASGAATCTQVHAAVGSGAAVAGGLAVVAVVIVRRILRPSVKLELAWDFRDATPDVNGQLATVPDSSGNARDGTVAASLGARPVLSAEPAVGNAQVARFTAAAGHYVDSPSFSIPLPLTVALVVSVPTPGATRYLLDGLSALERVIVTVRPLPDGIVYSAPNNVASNTLPSGWQLIVAEFDRYRSGAWLDDMEAPISTGDPGNWFVEDGVRLCASSGGASLLTGDIAAVYLWSHRRQFAGREIVRGYVAQQWGVT